MGKRIEHDSMGEVAVPEEALYGAQTQRAVDNFPLSFQRMPRRFIEALSLIKAGAAFANHSLQLLDKNTTDAIMEAALVVARGEADAHFPIDIYQTGSGTSSNMNANEVIARLASQKSGQTIHPNDHVNMGQSSNDTIPAAISVSASLACRQSLLPALSHLEGAIRTQSLSLKEVVKTGRTHLMDAMPVTFGQELSGWAAQIMHAQERIAQTLPRVEAISLGGTAVGTGINAHPELAMRTVKWLAQHTQIGFTVSKNYFESLSSQDHAVELSGQLNVLACSLMKIANDLRWMNSGPLAGIGEITLPNLQPGSSIMPGKVNPVVPEAITMIAARVMGNHTTITIAGQSGNFQLNVMLPIIAASLLESISLLANGCRLLADKAISGFKVVHERVNAALSRNPILATALNTAIGYELGAKIVKTAYAENKPILEVAEKMSGLSLDKLKVLLDPLLLTKGGIPKG